ncbi:MAG: PEP-CTERM sorting domain-containing protein [Lentisphaerae bacterium]|jgi:hypothetical protein|nr:PEP-CTERM sorting domain-containing protein [Lentisphaerota bacterium]
MISWNPDAQQVFEQFCEKHRNILLAAGADPDEVFSDWRALIETRAAGQDEQEVGIARVHAETAQLADALHQLESMQETETVSPKTVMTQKLRTGFRHGMTILLWLLGVILPAGVLLFELIAGFCADILFDPLPTWFHTLLIALVPIANAWAMLAISRRRPSKTAGILNGWTLGVAAFYTLQFIVITPFAFMALIFFGLGLIPLAPLLALVSALLLRRRLRQTAVASRTAPPAALLCTALPAFLLLILLSIPQMVVPPCTHRAQDPDPATQRRAIRILRAIGDKDLLLRNCYKVPENIDLLSIISRTLAGTGNKRVSPAASQEAFYRVTGTPYNAVPPPRAKGLRGQDLFDTSWFDPALGGDQVAARIRHLTLSQSRLDGRIDTGSGIAYMEWTLEFANASPVAREARALIELPPGGVVSRVTLWINDEPHEAAFGGRSQTRRAYQQVAVQQRRDPVLVTTAGPDRVLLQCFPVPVDGTIKTRIGITAPLTVPDAAQAEALLRLPAFIEQNFGVASNVQTTVWLESDAEALAVTDSLSNFGSPGQPATIRGKLPPDSRGRAPFLRLPLALPPPPRIAKDQRLPEHQGILQTLQIPDAEPAFPSALAVVIDGSARMKPHAETIRSLLAGIPEATRLYCVIASDLPLAAEGLPPRRLRFAGGCDNSDALALAAEWAARHDHAPILWLHAAQPLPSAKVEDLRQAADFSRGKLRIHSVQFGKGANLIAEKMADLRVIRPLPVFDDSADAILQALRSPRPAWQRQLIAFADAPADTADGSSHIVRLWAAEEVARLSSPYRKDGGKKAVEIATSYQLVTPVSGAVVLETAAQYAAHNLTPVDAATTPGMVPEPGTLGLILLGGTSLWWIRRRRAKQAA